MKTSLIMFKIIIKHFLLVQTGSLRVIPDPRDRLKRIGVLFFQTIKLLKSKKQKKKKVFTQIGLVFLPKSRCDVLLKSSQSVLQINVQPASAP